MQIAFTERDSTDVSSSLFFLISPSETENG